MDDGKPRGFRVAGISYSALIVVTVPLSTLVGPDEAPLSILASGLLCFLHLITGHLLLEKSFEKPPMSFLRRVLGGMSVRMMGMLLIMLGLLRWDRIDDGWLLISMVLWYAIALGFEIFELQEKASLSQHNEA